MLEISQCITLASWSSAGPLLVFGCQLDIHKKCAGVRRSAMFDVHSKELQRQIPEAISSDVNATKYWHLFLS